MTNPVRLFARNVRIKLWGIVPLNAEPYATHMPVLTAVAAAFKISRVAEFGAGSYSTGHFLDREAFPDLEYLVSYEDDESWAGTVREIAAGDPRLDLRVVPSVPRGVPADLDGFDLVFIDDSPSAELREGTVSAVAAARPGALVVVHDFQLPALRRTSKLFTNCVIVKSLTPQVGILWNDPRFSPDEIRALADRVAAGSSIAATDTPAWAQHLKG